MKDIGLVTKRDKDKALMKVFEQCLITYSKKTGVCFQWSSTSKTGMHGRIRHKNKLVYPHRLVYMAAKGYIPPGYDIHHKCGNPLCCNPEHMIAIEHGKHSKLHRNMKELELDLFVN
jgi:hypothetical protein